MDVDREIAARICELRGSLAALDVALMSLVPALSDELAQRCGHRLTDAAEIARVSMLNVNVPDAVIDAFDQDIRRWQRLLLGTSRTRRHAYAHADGPETRHSG